VRRHQFRWTSLREKYRSRKGVLSILSVLSGDFELRKASESQILSPKSADTIDTTDRIESQRLKQEPIPYSIVEANMESDLFQKGIREGKLIVTEKAVTYRIVRRHAVDVPVNILDSPDVSAGLICDTIAGFDATVG